MKPETEEKKRGSVVTVGTFDGVHRGHESVLSTVVTEAGARGLRALAVTFDRHPLETIRPEIAPKLLMNPDGRDALIRSHGVDVLRVEFTEEVRRQTCAEWMRRLADSEGMEVLVLGYDNTFGSDGVEMSVEDYRRVGRELGVEVLVAPIIEGCSSSAAREAVTQGDMTLARSILGRPFTLKGRVAHGREIGRTIGVPTANLEADDRQLLPDAGVYSAEAIIPDGSRRLAVVNVGTNPTVADLDPKHVEVHILDFYGDIYGQTLTVEFGRKIRGERKFGSLAELQEAIAIDIAECRAI